jgi:hypothetical protein
MIFALALLLAQWVGYSISLAAASAPLSTLVGPLALQSACLFATLAALADQGAARLPRIPARTLRLTVVFVSFAYSLVDGTTLRYLRQDSAHSIPDLLSQYTNLRDTWSYARQYVGLPLLVVSAILHLAIGALALGRGARPARWVGRAAALAAVQAAGWAWPGLVDSGLKGLGADQGGIIEQPYLFRYRSLAASSHQAPVPRPRVGGRPATIVLFINESFPRFFPDSAGRRGLLLSGIIARAPAAAGPWMEFPQARTNASMTDISVPSMLTGVDPIEGASKLEAMPFVFDLARAAGYQTAFFTSQDYTVNFFHDFYRPARIGTYVTGDQFALPKVNESGIDDMVVADRVVRFIRGLPASAPVFLVVNTNALHVPLQQASEIPIPASIATREARAAYVLEQYYARVLGALQDTGRLAGSLVVITSDHGESDPQRPRLVARQRDHYEEVINVPFYVHLPSGSPPDLVRRLARNTARNIANVDIAPTLADCLGFGPPADLAYAGCSLFEPVPADRLTDSVTTCEWRQWSYSAFGLARADERLVFIEGEGAAFFDVARDPSEARPVESGERFDSYLRQAAAIPAIEEILLHR